MKRPGVVWIFSVLVLIGILNNLVIGVAMISLGTSLIFIIGILMLLIEVPWILLLVDFFTLNKKAKLWAHISFGSVIGLAVIHYIIFFATIGSAGALLIAPPSILMLAIYVFVWWGVVDYIKKKKVEEQQLFN